MNRLQLEQQKWKCMRAAITDMYKNFMLLCPMYDEYGKGELKVECMTQVMVMVHDFESMLGKFPTGVKE